jgi:hypothetical protein
MELILEFNDLVEKERAIVSAHVRKESQLNEREALVNKKEGDLNLREKSLDAREAMIVPIENITNFKKETQALSDKTISEIEKLQSYKALWEKQVQSDKGQIEEDRKTSKKEADNNFQERKNIESISLKRTKEILTQFGHSDLADKL